jgi:hypothetical protein
LGGGGGEGGGEGDGLIHNSLIRRIHDIYEKVFQFSPSFPQYPVIMTYFVTITLAEWCDASRKTGDHYAHVFKRLTVYRHKNEIRNPKKKSTV